AILSADAGWANLAGPAVQIIADQIINDRRRLLLKIRSPRHAPIMRVRFINAENLARVVINDKQFFNQEKMKPGDKPPVRFTFWGIADDGLTLEVLLGGDQRLNLNIIDQSFCL